MPGSPAAPGEGFGVVIGSASVSLDGGIEDKPQRLNALLSPAEVVICTVDHVSHDAYKRSKRFRKRSAKPCVLLRSFDVSTFARALEQVVSHNHIN